MQEEALSKNLMTHARHMDNQDSFWQLILHAQAHFNHPMHIPLQKRPQCTYGIAAQLSAVDEKRIKASNSSSLPILTAATFSNLTTRGRPGINFMLYQWWYEFLIN